MTASFAQTGSKHVVWNTGETLTCYTVEELRKIANMTAKAKEAIELYKISEQQLSLKDSIIFAKEHIIISKDSVIDSRELVIELKEGIITGKDYEISELRLELDKANTKIKWLNFKYGTGVVVLSGLLVYTFFK